MLGKYPYYLHPRRWQDPIDRDQSSSPELAALLFLLSIKLRDRTIGTREEPGSDVRPAARCAAWRWRSSGRCAAAVMPGCAPCSTPPSTPSAVPWCCTRTCGRPLAFLLCCPCTTSPWPLYASSLSQLVAKAFVSTRPGPGRSGVLASRSRTCPCAVQNAWLPYSIQRFVFL